MERLSLCRTFALPDCRCAWYTGYHTVSEPPGMAHNPRPLVRWTGGKRDQAQPNFALDPIPLLNLPVPLGEPHHRWTGAGYLGGWGRNRRLDWGGFWLEERSS